ncbi:hypothetical protein [uncultured Psychroserpens sp.]|uniref:hypothetical protein n=1 Tax=uncultured Psychroserpens sp. TaxID=255436 RepID=UPI0026394C1A|nr:hypothetical protein [uncultured Psychroserpens sp.]
MQFTYHDTNHTEQHIDLPITTDQFNTVKLEVEGSRLDDIDYWWAFWAIRDSLFKQLHFDIHAAEIKAFIKRLQLNQFDFTDPNADNTVKVVDVYYNVYYWDMVFVAGEPGIGLYDGITKDRLELHLEFDVDEFEHLLEQLLDAFGVIDYEEYQEEDDLATFELSADALFVELFRECWADVKADTKSDMIGMLFQATGIGDTTDLDTHEAVDQTEDGYREYLKGRGVEL